jgi:hypothetical protein
MQSVGLLGWEIGILQGCYLHRATQTQNKWRQTPVPQVGFEPTIPVFERAKTFYALDHEATVISAWITRGLHSGNQADWLIEFFCIVVSKGIGYKCHSFVFSLWDGACGNDGSSILHPYDIKGHRFTMCLFFWRCKHLSLRCYCRRSDFGAFVPSMCNIHCYFFVFLYWALLVSA